MCVFWFIYRFLFIFDFKKMKIGKWNVFVCRNSCDVFKYFNNDKNCYMLIKNYLNVCL